MFALCEAMEITPMELLEYSPRLPNKEVGV